MQRPRPDCEDEIPIQACLYAPFMLIFLLLFLFWGIQLLPKFVPHGEFPYYFRSSFTADELAGTRPVAVITIAQDGTIALGDSFQIERRNQNLAPLREHLKNGRFDIAIIRPNSETKYEQIIEVIDTVSAAGVPRYLLE